MFRSGGTATTATTATIGTVAEGTTPTPQLASAPLVLPSAHDSAAAWRLPRLNGTTAARSRAGSAAATNPDSFPISKRRRAVHASPPAHLSRRLRPFPFTRHDNPRNVPPTRI